MMNKNKAVIIQLKNMFVFIILMPIAAIAIITEIIKTIIVIFGRGFTIFFLNVEY